MVDRSNSAEADVSITDGMSWKVLILVVLLAVIFWLFMTRSAPQAAHTHPAVGSPAPALDLVQLVPAAQAAGQQDPEAEPVADVAPPPATLTGLPAAGKVTLLHFWGTWCPPCRLEYPELVEMIREMESEPGFQFVTVSCGGGGPEEYDPLQAETTRYYREIDAGDLITYADLNGATRQSLMAQLNEPVVYPTTVLISPEQRIAAVWLGYSPAGVSEMRQVAEELLQQAQ